MGRYYGGDIEGKFWFGVQSSDDASFFGGEESEPTYISYCFTKEDKEDMQKGIDTCNLELGDWKMKLDKFFKDNLSYNDAIVKDYGLNVEMFRSKLVWYARLDLGQKIFDYVEEHGECNFEAEC